MSHTLHTHKHFVQTHTLPIWLAAQMVAEGDARGQKDSANQLHTHKGQSDRHVIVHTCMHKCSMCGKTHPDSISLSAGASLPLSLHPCSHKPNGSDVSFICSATRSPFVKLNFHFGWKCSFSNMYICARPRLHKHSWHMMYILCLIFHLICSCGLFHCPLSVLCFILCVVWLHCAPCSGMHA